MLRRLTYIVAFFLPLTVGLSRSLANNYDLELNDNLSERHMSIPNSGLKVMWWNIGCSLEAAEKKFAEKNTTNIERNLLAMSQSNYKPDVLILGEFCPYHMSSQDQNALKSLYRYSDHIEANVPQHVGSDGKINVRNGFLILSNFSISRVKNETLPAKTNAQESKDDRRFVVYQITKGNKDYFINPVHLVNPWRKIFADKGLFGAALEITGGRDNSNAVQVQNLKSKIEASGFQSERFLSIGDFNSPGSLKGFSGYAYKLMSDFMDTLKRSHTPTFVGEGSFPASDIDHAFGANIQPLYSEVWPLEGSRHLPIYLVID